MWKSKRFLVFQLLKCGLVVALVACVLAVGASLTDAHIGKARLPALDFESMDAIERQAWQLAEEMVGTGRNVQEQFVADLLELYYSVKDSDFAIFCSSGGWGSKPLSADYQGESWLAGIERKLTEMGYRYYVVDEVRTGSGLGEYLFEFKEHLMHYPAKAKKMAAEIEFLTKHITDLKIIIAGQSNGAAFASEVGEYLSDNPEVYSIEAGIPFWYQAPSVKHALVIDNSGLGNDALAGGDLVTLLRANCVKLLMLYQAPSFTPVDWVVTRAFFVFGSYNFNLGMMAPGHEYMWEYPGVGPVIEAFMVESFGL